MFLLLVISTISFYIYGKFLWLSALLKNYLPVYCCSYFCHFLLVCFLISVLLVFLLVKLSRIWLVTNYKKNCACLQKAWQHSKRSVLLTWKIKIVACYDKTLLNKNFKLSEFTYSDFSLMCSSSNRNTISWSESFFLPPLSGPCQATNKILSFCPHRVTLSQMMLPLCVVYSSLMLPYSFQIQIAWSATLLYSWLALSASLCRWLMPTHFYPANGILLCLVSAIFFFVVFMMV